MNTNGEDFINALCNRLRDEGKLCTDSQICILLRSLDRYEVSQIVTFGITDKWKRERLEKVRSLNAHITAYNMGMCAKPITHRSETNY